MRYICLIHTKNKVLKYIFMGAMLDLFLARLCYSVTLVITERLPGHQCCAQLRKDPAHNRP